MLLCAQASSIDSISICMDARTDAGTAASTDAGTAASSNFANDCRTIAVYIQILVGKTGVQAVT